MGGWYEAPLRYCHRYGETWATSERLEGIAGWVAGDCADMTFWRMLRSGALASSMRMGMGMVRHAARMRPISESLASDRNTHMKGRPYLYLQVIGVASQFQGQGWGGRLLRAIIAESERRGLPLYLETETEQNVRM